MKRLLFYVSSSSFMSDATSVFAMSQQKNSHTHTHTHTHIHIHTHTHTREMRNSRSSTRGGDRDRAVAPRVSQRAVCTHNATHAGHATSSARSQQAARRTGAPDEADKRSAPRGDRHSRVGAARNRTIAPYRATFFFRPSDIDTR